MNIDKNRLLSALANSATYLIIIKQITQTIRGIINKLSSKSNSDTKVIKELKNRIVIMMLLDTILGHSFLSIKYSLTLLK